MSKAEETTSDSGILLIGGPKVAIDDRKVCRIGDDWAALMRGPDGRRFHDFKYYVIWPTSSWADMPTDCYAILLHLISNVVAGSVIILVIPEWAEGLPPGLRWLSRSLSCVRSEDKQVQEAPTPADIPNKIVTSIYSSITGNVEKWPPILFEIPARDSTGYTEGPLAGFHKWGKHFVQCSGTYESDNSFGPDVLNMHKNVSVFTMPGHTNMSGGYKSLLFISGLGGVIIIPEIIKLPRLIDILLEEDNSDNPSLLTNGEPKSPMTDEDLEALIHEGKSRILELTGRRENKTAKGKYNRWIVKLNDTEVLMGHKTFLILLAHVLAAMTGKPDIDPQSPKIDGHSIHKYYKTRTVSSVGKPADEVYKAFEKSNASVHIIKPAQKDANSGGRRLYRLKIPSKLIHLAKKLKESKNEDVHALLKIANLSDK